MLGHSGITKSYKADELARSSTASTNRDDVTFHFGTTLGNCSRYYANSRSSQNLQIHAHRKIIITDEAHFWFNDFVNRQNSRYWG